MRRPLLSAAGPLLILMDTGCGMNAKELELAFGFGHTFKESSNGRPIGWAGNGFKSSSMVSSSTVEQRDTIPPIHILWAVIIRLQFHLALLGTAPVQTCPLPLRSHMLSLSTTAVRTHPAIAVCFQAAEDCGLERIRNGQHVADLRMFWKSAGHSAEVCCPPACRGSAKT